MKQIRISSTIWAIVIAFGLTVMPVWAHGGGAPQLVNAEAGPYRVSLWTQPDPLQAGEVHFTVAVTAPPPQGAGANRTGPPIPDAVVNLHLTPLDAAAQAVDIAATHKNAVNKLFYEADTILPTAGRRQVIVQVNGPDGAGIDAPVQNANCDLASVCFGGGRVFGGEGAARLGSVCGFGHDFGAVAAGAAF